MLFYTII